LDQLYQSLTILISQSIIELSENEEPALVLLKTLSDSPETLKRYKICWFEIFKLIASAKKFSLMLKSEIKEILANTKQFAYEALTPNQHIEMLLYLINISYDTLQIRTAVRKEMDKKLLLVREKQYLEIEL
jgi:hypothetical protein